MVASKPYKFIDSIAATFETMRTTVIENELISAKEIIDRISGEVDKLLAKNHWNTYEGFTNYDKEIKRICGGYLKEIMRELSNQKIADNVGISIPFVVFYLHSEILKGRVAIPVFLLEEKDESRYEDFFKVYKGKLNKDNAKR